MMNRKTSDILLYSTITMLFMATSAFAALEGWFGAGLIGFEGEQPRPSDNGYITNAAIYGAICGLGCSTPFFVLLLITRFRSAITYWRIALLWFVGNMSACFFAALIMTLWRYYSAPGEDNPIEFIALGAAVPPGLVGLRLIVHIARDE